jgi:hypothetical protein
MPSGNFDDTLTIDGHGCVAPAGPMELADGETMLRLDAWVFQQQGSCVAVQCDFPDRTRWTTAPNPNEDHSGARFVPGDATGMALMVSRTAAGQTEVFQWTETIMLVAGKAVTGHDDH